MVLPATSQRFDDTYRTAPNPYNLDPETGLPYKTPEQQLRSRQMSKLFLWGMVAVIILAVVISLFE
jgi:hypothetical protein